MKKLEVDAFEKLVAQITGIYEELSILSRKKPGDAVNKFKLGFVNALIDAGNQLLGTKNMPFDDFVRFDVDDVPQNSDVVFILSQYLSCFERYRLARIANFYGSWYWTVQPEKGDKVSEDGYVHIRTAAPAAFKG